MKLSLGRTKPLNPVSRHEGRIDRVHRTANKTYAYGWLWDPEKPDEPVEAEILLQDRVLANVMANKQRRDLKLAGKGKGYHSFELQEIDHTISDENLRLLRLRATGETAWIMQDDCQVMLSDIIPVEGRIDKVVIYPVITVVYGWLWDPERPDVSLTGNLVINQQRLAGISADVVRTDLIRAGKGNGKHGFESTIFTHLKPGEVQCLRIQAEGQKETCTLGMNCEIEYVSLKSEDLSLKLLKKAEDYIDKGELSKAERYLKKTLLLNPGNEYFIKRLLHTIKSDHILVPKESQQQSDILENYKRCLAGFTLLLDEIQEDLKTLERFDR